MESSTRGQDVNIAGQNLPSFGSRKVVTRLRLRDGESNLLAGLLREEERRSLRGVPGILRLPILRNLLASNDNEIRQTDIVMLLTPRIVRTQELTVQDVSPIFIGSQQSLGLGGPPPLIAAPAVADPGVLLPAAAQPAATEPAVPQPGAQQPLPTAPLPAVPQSAIPQPPPGPTGAPAAGVVVVPPGSSQIPGTTTVQAAPTPPAVTAPAAIAGGQVLLSPPGTDFRVGAGPYTVPVSITGASQVSSLTLTITFNPAALRVRAVQEGSFMRTGGVAAAFTQQVDAAAGRIDIAIVRTGDATGVAGTGLLAAVLFDAVGGGSANLAVTGGASGPRGTPVTLQFAPVAPVSVR